MIQPTKDEIRGWLSEARNELRSERFRRRLLEHELCSAKRALGNAVLKGQINVPIEKLGELVLKLQKESETEEADM
ncbi:hypothetical protein [Rhodopseudomonas palustris]|uniref:hypothetical protein n=1 Tax=Rhodopseudomonas palustris TaxID=1076 RepID=UPI0012ED1B85|nr:hypothetical protein [Rhodopseudomonas palustris]